MNNIADLLRGLEAVADGQADQLSSTTRFFILQCVESAASHLRRTLETNSKPADAVAARIVSNDRIRKADLTTKNAENAERRAA